VGHVLALDTQVDRRWHVPHVEWPFGCPGSGHRVIDALEHLRGRGKRLRIGQIGGHLDLVIEPAILVLERGDHREDRQTLLIGLGSARRERAPVVNAIDGERDRQVDVAGAEEVSVQRVDVALRRDRALGGDERLGEHLAAEHPAERHPQAGAREDVLARTSPRVGQVERSEKAGQRVAHAL
jgi:hypothetical protein